MTVTQRKENIEILKPLLGKLGSMRQEAPVAAKASMFLKAARLAAASPR